MMTTYRQDVAPTRFVGANGIRFGYRRFRNPQGVPIVLNQHFRGTMNYWDPVVTDGLARARELILFDNTGIASSSQKHLKDIRLATLIAQGSNDVIVRR